MTYSIVAQDGQTGELGVAVASRFFAVGALVPHIRAGKGAVATQAFVSPLWGIDAADRLATGQPPQDVCDALVQADAGRANRQLHMVDAHGRTAAYTGPDCVGWSGHLTAQGVSVAGNMLAGEAVVRATLEAYRTHADLPLIERLMTAMEAGADAGGDKRGTQSAALIVHRSEPYPWLDLRADDHPDPLAEMRRLYAVAQERFLVMSKTLPTRANPHGTLDRTAIDAEIATQEERRKAAGQTSRSFATPL
ncbi:DUF1028 domain-containing protein [Aestuariivita sp.]|jgi:uncharacterized Ntn-hydrolase superfamily protein|uniref:DUF1028 domain-containing protein n=1 Tax=Aestuariivita sp. TaxID=1872407 RepID=UPI00216F7A50|nr:DUF1028 domain-containing protein [Aestuariivita sp.]MCE8009820.1 DUF1028 domain-containing protein [Aestuariivita sp.]